MMKVKNTNVEGMHTLIREGEYVAVEFGGNDLFIGDWYNVTTQNGRKGVLLGSELEDFVL